MWGKKIEKKDKNLPTKKTMGEVKNREKREWEKNGVEIIDLRVSLF